MTDRPLRIALLGGVFDAPLGEYALSAPENVLLRFLREAGHEVVPVGVNGTPPLDERVDVYHANHFGVGTYGLTLARARPLVFTSHNPFLVSDFPIVRSRVDRVLQPKVLRTADVVVALSRREATLLRERFGIPDSARVEVIPNGLDLDLYAAPGEGTAEPELLAVGQLVDYKGHEYLLRAAARLAPRFPGLRIRLVTTQYELRPELERLASELGIGHNLAFEGPLKTDELARRYGACAIFVQPSLAECFPVTVLEAMACRRPVVATNVGGVAEQLGDAGMVVEPRDVNGLAAALERLLADRELRRRLGDAGRARCEKLYDGRRIASQHAALYAELAAGRERRRPSRARAAGSRAALAALRHRTPVARLLPSARR